MFLAVPLPPPPGRGRQFWSLLTLRLFLFVCSSFFSIVITAVSSPNTPCACVRVCVHYYTPGRKTEMLWVCCLAPFSTSSDSDRGPPMRGVDSRGGGLSGNSGNPPPAGGRGRGMVLPAWLVAQQNAQMAGPVSFFLLLQPGRALADRPKRTHRHIFAAEKRDEREVCVFVVRPGNVSDSQVRLLGVESGGERQACARSCLMLKYEIRSIVLSYSRIVCQSLCAWTGCKLCRAEHCFGKPWYHGKGTRPAGCVCLLLWAMPLSLWRPCRWQPSWSLPRRSNPAPSLALGLLAFGHEKGQLK